MQPFDTRRYHPCHYHFQQHASRVLNYYYYWMLLPDCESGIHVSLQRIRLLHSAILEAIDVTIINASRLPVRNLLYVLIRI